MKRVLITGGSSGLGRALAIALAGEGAKVAVVARGRERLEALGREVPGLIPIVGDVSRKEETYRIAGEAIARLGGVDLLINNASELGPTPLRLLLDTECEDLARVLETNLLGPFRLMKAILPSLLLQKGGAVVNISSDAAVSAYPRWGAYGVSKAALDHLTRIFAAELEGQGVRFHAFDPGDMDTPMHLAAVPGADRSALRSPEESARRILAALRDPDVEIRRSL